MHLHRVRRFCVHRACYCPLNASRRFTSDSEGHPFVPPALWLCPMLVDVPFRGIREHEPSEPGYAKYLDWLHSPPHKFNRISSDILDQQSEKASLRTCLVQSDARKVNASCDMRMYIDNTHSCAVLKISPHVSRASSKALCNSIDMLPGCLGLTYHVRFPRDYPTCAPVVRMIIPNDCVDTNHALGLDTIRLDEFWRPRTSFEAAFRSAFCSATSGWFQ